MKPGLRDGLGVLIGLTALAALVRFATLDLQSFDHDEAVTAGRVILPNLFDTLDVVSGSERSPPLYYVLAWGWAKVFGTGEVGLRSLSALVGTLTVPAAWLAGRELVSRRVGLIAAAFVALNPYLVWYSQEARSYALMVLFSTLALAFFARLLRQPTPRALTLWAIASGLALCSHYFAAFLVIPQAIWLVWPSQGLRLRALAAVGAVAAVGLALLPLVVAQEGEGRRNAFTDTAVAVRAGQTALGYVASEEPDPLAGDSKVDVIQVAAAIAGAVLLAGAVTLIAARGSPWERHSGVVVGAIAASATAVPVALAFVGLDFLNPRNLIGGLVPLLALAAIGFGGARARRPGLVGAGATCLLFAVVLVAVAASAQMQRPDWRGAAEAIGTSRHTRILVVNANGDDPLKYYLGVTDFDPHRNREGLAVREIDALGTVASFKAPPGFHEVERHGLAPLFVLSRFESSRRRLVRPHDVAGRAVLSEPSDALIQRPDRGP